MGSQRRSCINGAVEEMILLVKEDDLDLMSVLVKEDVLELISALVEVDGDIPIPMPV